MRARTTLACLAMFAACAPAAETADGEGTGALTVSAMTLADFAGSWQVTSQLEGVEAPVVSHLTSTAAGTDWTTILEGRDPLPLQVSIMGDSLVTETAEYESILRAGVMVTVRTAAVMHDGMMMGNMVATYRTPTGNEVVNGTFTGTRDEH